MQNISTIGYFQLLRKNEPFRNLWFGQVVSELGDWLNSIAIYALILKLSDSGMAIAGAMMAKLLPIVLISPIAGVVVDRVDRKVVMISSDLLRFVVVLGFLFIEDQSALWFIYALVIIEISLSGFFEPARSAIIPSLVSKEHLVTANALSGSTWSVMLAFGAALGGVLVSLFGIQVAFILDACTFLISAWFISKIPSITKPAKNPKKKNGFQELSDAMRFLRKEPVVLVLSLLKSGLAVAGGIMTLIPLMASQVVYKPAMLSLGIGVLYSARGLGAAVGPLLVKRLFGETTTVLTWSIAVAFFLKALSYLFIGNSATLLTLSFGVATATLFGSIIWVFSSALIHLSTPDKYLGRVFSFELAVMTLVMGISNLGVGFATDELGLTSNQVAFAMAVLVTISGIFWTGFLVVIRRPFQQENLTGSVFPIDPSGFNPVPMAQEKKKEKQVQRL
tara:strand:- start:85 stop:1431 length:1347 start_codon:yes stop_codon:yes gene_type:complete